MLFGFFDRFKNSYLRSTKKVRQIASHKAAMTSLVALRSPHHEAFLPVDNTLDRKIVDLLENNGIKQNDFLKIVQHCYTLHQPMQEIQSNSTRAFKLVAIWYLVALAIWGVFIFATAVTVPLAYRYKLKL
jgi:hypothetical protein